MLKLSSEATESQSTIITSASEGCAAEHEGADGEACDSVLSGACTTFCTVGTDYNRRTSPSCSSSVVVASLTHILDSLLFN